MYEKEHHNLYTSQSMKSRRKYVKRMGEVDDARESLACKRTMKTKTRQNPSQIRENNIENDLKE
jgi:Tfp pilus assembly protein PilW